MTLLAAGGQALAQAVTFYEREGLNGRNFSEDNSVSNFAQFGFNDRAASVVIQYGRWQLCTDAYFRGRCVTLNPGRYNDLGAMGLSNAISSARQLEGGGPGSGPGYPPGEGGGAGLVLFDQDHQNGESTTVQGEIGNLDSTRWNDRAVSMVVNYGQWELCTDASFRGDCRTFGPGRYDDLGGLTRKVSSLRPAAADSRPPQSQPYPPNWGDSSRAILYKGGHLKGRSFVVTQDYLPNLNGTGFNDRASSLRVEGGYWMFCSDADFQGVCRTFGPGDYATLPAGLENNISSGRRISQQYPYNRNPEWKGRN